MQLVECVPNVSEGRDPQLLRELERIAASVDAAHLLDVHHDAHHHRSVFTLVGEPQAVQHAVLALAEASIARIDLRQHQGEHPRLGAIDVIPFVPVHDLSLDECVPLAEDTARRLTTATGVPTFLYGHAARVPHRATLRGVRGAGFEAHQRAATRGTVVEPDFGPADLHPSAGATAVGVRGFLVAFNVWLRSPDPAVARAIARRIRTANGGRPGIQALGFLVDGCAQVSMNLYDPARTTIVDAYDDVAAEAGRLGVRIDHSEIVGLAPAAALPDRGDRIALPGAISRYSLEAALAARYPGLELSTLR